MKILLIIYMIVMTLIASFAIKTISDNKENEERYNKKVNEILRDDNFLIRQVNNNTALFSTIK